MPWVVLTGALLLSLLCIGVLEVPFTLLHTLSAPGWFYWLGAIALLSWVLDD